MRRLGLEGTAAEEAYEEFAEAYPLFFTQPAGLVEQIRAIEQRALDLIAAHQEVRQNFIDARRQFVQMRERKDAETAGLREELAALGRLRPPQPGSTDERGRPALGEGFAQLQRKICALHSELVRSGKKNRDYATGDLAAGLSLLNEAEILLFELVARTVAEARSEEERSKKKREMQRKLRRIVEQVSANMPMEVVAEVEKAEVRAFEGRRVRKAMYRIKLTRPRAAATAQPQDVAVDTADAYFK